MRVLIVTNMYPSVAHPTHGIFIRRQVDALVASDPTISLRVCSIDTVRSKSRYVTGALRTLYEYWSFKPDLIHIHYGLSQLLCWFLPRKRRVVTFHGSDLAIPWQRRVSRFLLQHTSRVILVTSRQLEYLPERRDATVVPCGVDARVFDLDRTQARTKLGINQADMVVLFGSNPAREVKRYDRFLEVAAEMGRTAKGVRIMRLSDVGLQDVPALMVAADVLVLTSDREGSPVVTKEALCAGTRVVSTPVGDVAEQFAGLPGCTVAGWSADELAAAALRLLEGPPPDRSLARKRFDIAVEATALAAIYRSMVSTTVEKEASQ